MIPRRALAAAVGALALAWSCDPVLSDQISALGNDAPGVRNGPLHRPGQPCLLCHDGRFTDPSAFSVAGTVFKTAGSTDALAGATVTLTDSAGATTSTTTNAAGNFYLTPSQYSPRYPMHVTVTNGSQAIKMTSHVGWDGACAGCHADPAGPESPGHVYFDVGDGGTP